jgi:tryptophanyl-tRNA synthetase
MPAYGSPRQALRPPCRASLLAPLYLGNHAMAKCGGDNAAASLPEVRCRDLHRAGRHADAGVNAGLYNYPLLMAADILAFQAALVPVGSDQQQHVEVARDIAAAFNSRFGAVFHLPRALIRNAGMVPGLDGRKMSKSYSNEISLLAAPDEVRRRTMRIVTDSRSPEMPKDPERCNLFGLYRHMADEAAVENLRGRYLAGGVAYREVKETLAELLIEQFAEARRRYAALMDNQEKLVMMMSGGAAAARRTARETLAVVRRAIGIAADITGT